MSTFMMPEDAGKPRRKRSQARPEPKLTHEQTILLLMQNLPLGLVRALQTEQPWVENLRNGKLHLTSNGCLYAVTIRDREYHDKPTDDGKVCKKCRENWEQTLDEIKRDLQ